MREFGEILRKYHILAVKYVGSKGLIKNVGQISGNVLLESAKLVILLADHADSADPVKFSMWVRAGAIIQRSLVQVQACSYTGVRGHEAIPEIIMKFPKPIGVYNFRKRKTCRLNVLHFST